MSSEDDSSFSIDEIRRQLQALGYDHVNDERLHQFQSDLSRLMTTSNNSGCTTPKDVGAGDADYVPKPTMPRFDAFDPYSETVNYPIISCSLEPLGNDFILGWRNISSFICLEYRFISRRANRFNFI